MSVQTTPSRPAAKSIGAAVVDLLLTLAILAVTFLTFLIAPLLALGVAYLAYAVVHPRAAKRRAAAAAGGSSRPHASHGFGAGAS